MLAWAQEVTKIRFQLEKYNPYFLRSPLSLQRAGRATLPPQELPGFLQTQPAAVLMVPSASLPNAALIYFAMFVELGKNPCLALASQRGRH